ncbi:MAG: DUF6691 family protein [Myxococcota bacterium]
MTLRLLIFGALFGFVLSRVGATDYDMIFDLFALRNLSLGGVMAVAIALLAVAFWLIRRYSVRTLSGAPISLVPKPMTPRLALGALVFGVGWALSGTCPGTALAQLGEGKLAALATIAGILVSSALTDAPGVKRSNSEQTAPMQARKV